MDSTFQSPMARQVAEPEPNRHGQTVRQSCVRPRFVEGEVQSWWGQGRLRNTNELAERPWQGQSASEEKGKVSPAEEKGC